MSVTFFIFEDRMERFVIMTIQNFRKERNM